MGVGAQVEVRGWWGGRGGGGGYCSSLLTDASKDVNNGIMVPGVGLSVNTNFLTIPELGCPGQVELLNITKRDLRSFSLSALPALRCWL